MQKKSYRYWIAGLAFGLAFMSAGLNTEALPVSIRPETERQETPAAEALESSVLVKDWKCRIYETRWQVKSSEAAESLRTYAGSHFHLTDVQGNTLSEGDFIDPEGNLVPKDGAGQVCRDGAGWYILWASPTAGREYRMYVQADSDFAGGNNQILGVDGMSGLYFKANAFKADVPAEPFLVNVAVEVEALDVTLPVMQGMDLRDSEFLKQAGVRLNSVYGQLSDVPLKGQWYIVTETGEEAVGDILTGMPYTLPAEAAETLSEAREYRLKLYYNGEASTDRSRDNSSGYENRVSAEEPMAQAVLKNEMISGHLKVIVQLEQRPYSDGETAFHNFHFRLYRFDAPNQMITEETPYREYALGFETTSDETRKEIEITGLEEGWYTIVTEKPEAYYVERTEMRKDNWASGDRQGGSAGVDFHIGEIVENQYSWETIRYQGQDTEDPLGDNFFRVTFTFKETVYPVNYKNNLPEDADFTGKEPIDRSKYPAEGHFPVKGGAEMTADGWQFVGWSTEAGDGIYSAGETLYSDREIHGISGEKEAVMTEGGRTLYGQWIPVYTVSYDGNMHTGGQPPVDSKGTVKEGGNLYYSGDEIQVHGPASLEKADEDGTRYEFDGWSLNQDGSGARFQVGDRVKVEQSDLVFYAQWKPVCTDRYAVQYIASLPEGSRMTGLLPRDDQKYEEGSKVAVQGQGTIALEHYRFAGWALTSREDGLYQAGEELYGAKDIGKTVGKYEAVMKENGISFYSRWIPLYQIIYYTNGSDVEGTLEASKEYEATEMAEIASGEGIKRTGYEFVGWNTKRDGSGESYDGGMKFNMPKMNIELYAQWEKLPEDETVVDTEAPSEHSGNRMGWPLVIFAILGVLCIGAYIGYQWISHRK